MMEEKLGAFLLALILFSFTVSLIPLSQISSISWDRIELGGSNYIVVSLTLGSVELQSTNATSPYALVKGIQLSSRELGHLNGVSGIVRLYIPENWEGSIAISMRAGSVVLRGVKLGELAVRMDSGSVRGSFIVLDKSILNVGAGLVNAEVGVPQDSGLDVRIHCRRFSLRYNGETLLGDSLEARLWDGIREIYLEVTAYSADLGILRIKG